MTIDRAIELLDSFIDRPAKGATNEFLESIELGKEALDLVRHLRQPEFLRYLCLLPGETED